MTPAEKVEILRASCCIAGADQKTDGSERTLLDKMAKEIGVGKASLNAMVDRSEKDPDFQKQQFAILKSEPTQTMAILTQVAVVDGVIDKREMTC